MATVGVRAVLLPQRRAHPGLAAPARPGRRRRSRGYARRPRPGGRPRRAAADRVSTSAARGACAAVGQRHGELVRRAGPGARSSGSTASGRRGGAHHRRPGRGTARATTWRKHRGQRPGVLARRQRLDVGDQQHGRRPAAAASAPASRSAVAAADRWSARPAPAPRRRSTGRPTAAATARTSADLPEPAGPVTSTPSETVVPSRPSTSRWWKPRSSSSFSSSACARRPGRSSSAGRRRVRSGSEARPVGRAAGVAGRSRAAGGAAAVLPADHGVHGDQRRAAGSTVDDGEQRARPGVPDAVGQAAPGRLDQPPRAGRPAARPGAAARRRRRR